MTKSKKEHGALWDVRWGEGLESSFKGSYGQKEVGIWLEKRSGKLSNGFNQESDGIRFIL